MAASAEEKKRARASHVAWASTTPTPPARSIFKRPWSCSWPRFFRPSAPTSASTRSRRHCSARIPRRPITPGRRWRSWNATSKAPASFATRRRTSRPAAALCCEHTTARCPQEIEKLVELPGVGRKTANVVLGTAFGIAVGRGCRHARCPDQPATGADAAEGPREDRTRPDGTASAERVDRLESPHDPSRPRVLHGAGPRCDDARCESSVRGSAWKKRRT